MSNRRHTTAEQRKADRERTKVMQKAQREAVELCRMLVADHLGLDDFHEAAAKAKRVIDQIDGVK